MYCGHGQMARLVPNPIRPRHLGGSLRTPHHNCWLQMLNLYWRPANPHINLDVVICCAHKASSLKLSAILPSRTVSVLRKKLRPSLQINRLRLIEGHGFIHAHALPEQEFHFVFGQ